MLNGTLHSPRAHVRNRIVFTIDYEQEHRHATERAQEFTNNGRENRHSGETGYSNLSESTTIFSIL